MGEVKPPAVAIEMPVVLSGKDCAVSPPTGLGGTSLTVQVNVSTVAAPLLSLAVTVTS